MLVIRGSDAAKVCSPGEFSTVTPAASHPSTCVVTNCTTRVRIRSALTSSTAIAASSAISSATAALNADCTLPSRCRCLDASSHCHLIRSAGHTRQRCGDEVDVSHKDPDYARLLRFRKALRAFLRWSDERARELGVTPAQHQLLLSVRGHVDGTPTIGD